MICQESRQFFTSYCINRAQMRKRTMGHPTQTSTVQFARRKQENILISANLLTLKFHPYHPSETKTATSQKAKYPQICLLSALPTYLRGGVICEQGYVEKFRIAEHVHVVRVWHTPTPCRQKLLHSGSFFILPDVLYLAFHLYSL